MRTTFQTSLRQLRGLKSQEQFADWVGVARVTIARLEAGARPSLATASKLVACGMDPAVVTAAAVPTEDGGMAA